MALTIIWEKPKVRPDYIDNYILGLWDRIASGADLSKLVVTCLYRDAAEQARAMFNNLVINKPAHSKIQQQVNKIYYDNKDKLKDEEIIALMKSKIESIGVGVISHHSANVKYLITADFSYNQMPEEKREKFVESVRAVGNYQVTAFGHPMTKIKKGNEFYDLCFHLETPTYFNLTGIEVGEKLVVK